MVNVMMKTNPDPVVLAKAMKARKSVVQIYHVKKIDGKKCTTSSGTGFIIKTRDADCVVVTNRHVTAGEEPFDEANDKLFVRFIRGSGGVEDRPGLLRFYDFFVDLAFIEVQGLRGKMPPALRFTMASELQIGTSVVAIGYCNTSGVTRPDPDMPEVYARIPSVCPALIAGPVWRKGEDDKDEEEEDDEEEDEDEGHEQWLHLDSPSRDGCSGGPVMCARGVIGVVAQAALQITASVSTESVHEVLKRWLGIPLEDDRSVQAIIDTLL
ncbi:uncharacterized protein LOC119326689 [Triticum dicoccoides]|uniref:uncharacterized protein LOC119326689 n=1 Tax=Triticum dicoccoides TaxID=85692 RepID=UPI001891AB66|nr:uncharacterized protein LOC119326689 [Triticum dicoccoides]